MFSNDTKPSLATRLRDRIAGLSGDGGFTLLETLAVMVIVGLLAAITIPQLSKWREKSYVTALKSDARNIGLAIEAIYVDDNAYPATGTITISGGQLVQGASAGPPPVNGSNLLKLNNGVSFATGGTYATTAASTTAGDGFTFTLAHNKTSKTVAYSSLNGGIQ